MMYSPMVLFPEASYYQFLAPPKPLSSLFFLYPLSACAHLCPTLCDPLDCSPPGFSVHGVFKARILEWVSISYSRGSSRPREQAHVSMSPVLAGGFFTTSTTHKTYVHFNSHTTACPTRRFRLFCHLGAFLRPLSKAAQTDRRKGCIFGDKQGCLLTQLPLVVIL